MAISSEILYQFQPFWKKSEINLRLIDKTDRIVWPYRSWSYLYWAGENYPAFTKAKNQIKESFCTASQINYRTDPNKITIWVIFQAKFIEVQKKKIQVEVYFCLFFFT